MAVGLRNPSWLKKFRLISLRKSQKKQSKPNKQVLNELFKGLPFEEKTCK